MSLTSKRKSGKRSNHLLNSNPPKNKTGNSYLRKELRRDSVNSFEGVMKNCCLDKKDYSYVDSYVKKHKKRSSHLQQYLNFYWSTSLYTS